MRERDTSSLLHRLSPWRRMRSNWDHRARENAQHFIACGHSETDATFWESGKWDLDNLILRDTTLGKEARALEIGCGLGRLLRPLSERIEKAYGCDISVEMIERGKRALADRPNIELFATRGRLNAIPSESLDFVYSFIVFQHIPTKKAVTRYIRETARVLAGQGVFRFQVDGRRREGLRRKADTWLGVWYEPHELVRELSLAGFEVLGIWGQDTHYLWLTARRKSEKGRRVTGAVQALPRSWRREAVRALLTRMTVEASDAAVDAVIEGRASLRRLAEGFLAAERESKTPPDEFVRRAYRVFLGREPDEGGLAFYTKEIVGGHPPSNTVDCLLSCAELEEKLRPTTPEPPAG